MFDETTNTEEQGVAELEIDGEKYSAEKVKQMADDLRNNENWRAKNTQEAQSLAEQRKLYENYAKLDEYLRDNPDKAEAINAAINGSGATNLDDLSQDEQVKAVHKELSRLREEFGKLRQSTELSVAKKEMEKEISEAIKQYPDADEREILNALRDGSHESIEALAKKSHQENNEREQKIIQKYLDKKKGKLPVAGKGGGAPAPKSGKVLGFNDPGFNRQVAETLESMDTEKE